MNLTRRTWLGHGLATTLLPWLATNPAWAQGQPTAAPPARSAAAQALHALFERYWDDTARQYPEWATYRGDHRYGDRFTDASPEAEAERDAQGARWLAEARAIPREPLAKIDRSSRDMFIHDLEAEQRLAAFTGWRTLSLGSLWGVQSALAGLLQAMPTDTEAQVEQMLARLSAYPTRMAQEIARLERGLALGWVTPGRCCSGPWRRSTASCRPRRATGPTSSPSSAWGPLSSRPAARRCKTRARLPSRPRCCPRCSGCAPSSSSATGPPRPRPAACVSARAVPRCIPS